MTKKRLVFLLFGKFTATYNIKLSMYVGLHDVNPTMDVNFAF